MYIVRLHRKYHSKAANIRVFGAASPHVDREGHTR